MRSRRIAFGAVCVAACLAAHAWIGRAHAEPASAPAPPPARITTERPLLIRIPADPPSSQRGLVRLTVEQLGRFREAQNFRAGGLHERARDVLLDLDRQAPHHPLVLTELGQVYLDLQDFAAAEKLGRTERLAVKDSLLLGHELTTALEHLGKPRDAAQVALEVWIAAPADGEWANATVQRLAPADTRGIRDALRKAADRLPDRADLQCGLAQLEWQSGNLEAALRAFAVADRTPRRPSWRWTFADELLGSGSARDSTGAIEFLTSIAGDTSQAAPERVASARRAWPLVVCRGAEGTYGLRLNQALKDIPAERWDSDLLLGIARGLREAGQTNEARTLLAGRGGDPTLERSVSLERALADLRDGPPEKALVALEAASHQSLEALARFADALFYAGLSDSALGRYQEVAKQSNSPFAGAALERIYLIEDAAPKTALAAFGRMAYAEWRGNRSAATAIAESLYRTLPRGPLWANAALALSAKRETAGDAKAALEPALAVADSLPGDRLAPVARQRAGDLYLDRLKDESKALAQYEECLARYPRAWNAAEVRRRVELLRRDRRF